MKAAVCKEYGPPETLVVEEIETPTAGEGQLLIDVYAAGVNFPDALMVEDKYQFKRKPPFVPGAEVAGVVTAVGEGVANFAVGDRVFSGGSWPGGFAEQAVLSAAGAIPIPDGKGFAQAASLGTVYCTSYYALVDRGGLQAGETLLVLGAAGGTGLSAIEIGKALGATVIAAASSDEKLELCRKHGADHTINYASENLKDRAKELTGGKGANVVYDPVGGDVAEAALRATAWEGRFLVIGFTGGIPSIPLNLPLLKSYQIVGVFLGGAAGRDPSLHQRLMEASLQLWREDKIEIPVTQAVPLEGAGQLLRDMVDRKVIGKVVVTPNG